MCSRPYSQCVAIYHHGIGNKHFALALLSPVYVGEVTRIVFTANILVHFPLLRMEVTAGLFVLCPPGVHTARTTVAANNSSTAGKTHSLLANKSCILHTILTLELLSERKSVPYVFGGILCILYIHLGKSRDYISLLVLGRQPACSTCHKSKSQPRDRVG